MFSGFILVLFGIVNNFVKGSVIFFVTIMRNDQSTGGSYASWTCFSGLDAKWKSRKVAVCAVVSIPRKYVLSWEGISWFLDMRCISVIDLFPSSRLSPILSLVASPTDRQTDRRTWEVMVLFQITEDPLISRTVFVWKTDFLANLLLLTE